MLILIIVAAAFLPDTLLGWAVVLSSIAATIAVLAGAILWLMKKMLEVIVVKLDGLASRSKETEGKVEKMEQTLNNGLTDRQKSTERKVDRMGETLVNVQTSVAEIHGMLTATHGWDGDERRGVV